MMKLALMRTATGKEDPEKSVLWSDESKLEIFGSNRRVFVRCRLGVQMISAYVVQTMKHGLG